MICVTVVLERNLKGVIMEISEQQKAEELLSLILRVTTIERVLVKKNIITSEEFAKELEEITKSIVDVFVKQSGISLSEEDIKALANLKP